MNFRKSHAANLDSPSGSGASHLERPTLVMSAVENFGDPPCAIDAFMSTIKMFPMAMLPGWPFAPSSTPGAWFVQRQFEPRPFEHDSLNIYSLNIVLK
jgi:hypothetical protein